MCGRYALTAPASRVAEVFEVDVLPEILPRYNIAPTQSVPVILEQDGTRTCTTMSWGLLPFWAKDRKMAYKTINARGETVAEKPAFRASFKKKRCLIVADGYYEWKRLSKTEKIPHLMRIDGGGPFAMAGLWSQWRDPETGEDVLTCTIVTTSAAPGMEDVHDRMPVILDARDWDAWLSADTPPEALKELIRPFDVERIGVSQVSSFVNNARNQGEACQAPFEA
ncbi:MAG: SOS response-associated peptidase [Myxococcales bacterium]|nr:SOS response-associated peptidase [Myxococcales bacterium]MCB9671799.1 SOS response-associated peptidase [Alphaproteobacteria bacterium]